MEIIDQKILDYLHDAKVDRITYELSESDGRSVLMIVKCHPEAGYSAWDGKCLTIKLQDIGIFSFSAFGAIVGKEEINAWYQTVSPETELEIIKLHKFCISGPTVRFNIVFQSGSVLQGLCRRIIVEEILDIEGPDTHNLLFKH